MAEIIIKTDDVSFEDKEARQWLKYMEDKVNRINERTKKQTMEIKKLNSQIKQKDDSYKKGKEALSRLRSRS